MVVSGLALEQFAGVTVALEAGLALSEILAQEQIDPAAWPDAERGFREAINESTELRLEYMKCRRQAEDALARTVEPLEDDVGAWVGLLGALAVSDEPAKLAQGLGMTMTDVGRLGRHWKRKTADDPSLAKQMAELAGKSQPPSRVTVGPVVLKPFPWSPKKVDAPSTSKPRSFDDEIAGVRPIETDVDLFAALSVVLEIAPQERRTAISMLGLDDDRHRAVDAAWRMKLLGDADLRADFSVKVADYRSAFRRLLAGARPLLG